MKKPAVRRSRPAKETKSEQQTILAAGFPEIYDDQPDSPANNRLHLFPIDPYHIFSYWDINKAEFDKIRGSLLAKYKHLAPTLRFFDDGTERITGHTPGTFFDLTVDLAAGKQYIYLEKSGRTCFADLGFKNEHGRFFPVSRSNTIETPQDMPGDEGLQCDATSPVHSDLSRMNEQSFMPGISSMPAES